MQKLIVLIEWVRAHQFVHCSKSHFETPQKRYSAEERKQKQKIKSENLVYERRKGISEALSLPYRSKLHRTV